MKSPNEAHSNFPTLLQALFVIAFLFLVQFLVALAYFGLFGRYESGDAKAVGIILVISYALVFAALMTFKRLSLADLLHPGQSSTGAVVIVLALPTILFFSGMAVLLDDLLRVVQVLLPVAPGQFDNLDQLMSNGVMSLLLLCVVAPFFEEILCRGIFLRSFLNQYSRTQAIVFSSALFAIFHMNVYQGLAAFILGCGLAWITVRAHSLWPCILGHATYNFSCYALGISLEEVARAQGAAAVADGAPVGMQLLALLSVAGGGYLFWKILGRTTVRAQ